MRPWEKESRKWNAKGKGKQKEGRKGKVSEEKKQKNIKRK